VRGFDASLAAMFDQIREERDCARRRLTTALGDHDEAMTALGTELASVNAERDMLRAALEQIQAIASQI
jgi:hypothetical protein